ncbi:pantoate--beta-alanine ligase [Pelagicoccus sp. SDUM812003]|uniref:pantoate--beta-alanine ligase n=1 Tax=Pelagicoccus sp. SDUM812003 TaxID=3041267 RepID=UPI00280FC1D6|nr:pantoate--beta-alanine ligase [Pelagicoccus sp. SDUM812003]MDQ8205541.1 pantoate--beta-alanine ligase [Pelagicoccus sp. SDUM812003]
MLQVIKTASAFRDWRNGAAGGKTLGFIPTMGGLHAAHLSLAQRSLAENDLTAVSIYLNRTQFNNPEDFEKYPADFQEDLAALEELGVQAVFAPTYEEMYPDDYRYRITESEISTVLEGEHRPGHFDGVMTVVMKLLCIADATRAYFGEKDWQQLQLVRGMVEAFFLPVEIVPCPTGRTESGLAMSSRNRRLSPQGLELAARFNQAMRAAETPQDATRELETLGFEVEYVADLEGRRLGAVVLEGVRLIDNMDLAETAAAVASKA